MINAKNLLRIDAIGALFSCFFIGGLMIPFQSFIGLPHSVLTILALLATLFCLHSSFAFFRYPKSFSMHLRLVTIANLLYALLSIGVLVIYIEHMSLIGKVYFIAELSILSILIILEWKYVQN